MTTLVEVGLEVGEGHVQEQVISIIRHPSLKLNRVRRDPMAWHPLLSI